MNQWPKVLHDHVPQNNFERNIRQSIHSDNILSYERSVSLMNTLKLSSSGFDANLERVLKFGCAFHHAGMTTEERGTVEQGFRDGTIRILCCRTTLSAGVNLPARRVMIISPYDHSNKLLPVGIYRQMIGRAGRKGIDTMGESYLFCTDKDINMARRLITTKMPSIKSNLITIQKLKNKFIHSSFIIFSVCQHNMKVQLVFPYIYSSSKIILEPKITTTT